MGASTAPDPRDHALTALRAVEVAALLLGVALIGVLHVIRPTSGIDPLAVTISEYGRSPLAALFVAGVALIALGSTTTLVLLVRGGGCRALSVPSVGLALWVAGMVGVAVFQKADWAAGATLGGHIHRAASVVAFVALPVAVLVLARGLRRRIAVAGLLDRSLPAVAGALTLALLVSMTVLGVYIGAAEADGSPWWTVLPIGLIERVIVFIELSALALVVLATRREARAVRREVRAARG